MNTLILVYSTTPTQELAEKIATHLLEKKFAACVMILPGQSMYRWQGALVKEQEWVLIIKTTDHHFDKLCEEIQMLHAYQIPCIVKIPATTHPLFAQWITDELA